MTPSKIRRRWLKFVSSHGMYEKCIKVTGEVSIYEYDQLIQREVILNSALFRGDTVQINGYFRVRTDREYYPICGKRGIPHDERSGIAKDFWNRRTTGAEKGRSALFWQKRAKEEAQKKVKAIEDKRTARDLPRADIAARLRMPVAMASNEIIEAKRNQIATLRVIKQIKKLTNENSTNESN